MSQRYVAMLDGKTVHRDRKLSNQIAAVCSLKQKPCAFTVKYGLYKQTKGPAEAMASQYFSKIDNSQALVTNKKFTCLVTPVNYVFRIKWTIPPCSKQKSPQFYQSRSNQLHEANASCFQIKFGLLSLLFTELGISYALHIMIDILCYTWAWG